MSGQGISSQMALEFCDAGISSQSTGFSHAQILLVIRPPKKVLYTRFLESMDIPDPETSNGDQLILRITKTSGGSQGLGVMVETAAPNDSYIEVPRVDI